jgi:hypothetical protein
MLFRNGFKTASPDESMYHSKKVMFKELLKKPGPPLHQNALERPRKLKRLQNLPKHSP